MRLKSLFNSFSFVWNHPCNRYKQIFVLFKILFWQIYKRTIKVPFIGKLFNGTKFIFHTDSTISSSIIYSKIPEYNEIMFLRNILKKGSLIMDVGANVGHFSLSFADVSEQIYAFEPTPLSFKYLQENFKLNKNYNLKAISKAVSSSVGSVEFLDSGGTNTTNRIVANIGNKTITVSTTTIDDFIQKENVKRLDLIKIDVEGNEIEVLKGAVKSITQFKPLILFEVLDPSEIKNFQTFFRSLDYKMFTLIDEKSISLQEDDIKKSQNLFSYFEQLITDFMKQSVISA